jgi:hypothetical protein
MSSFGSTLSASQVSRARQVTIRRVALAVSLVAAVQVLPGAARAATSPWTQVVNAPPNNVFLSSLQLLTDGSVLAGNGNQSWYKLTPDSSGKYETGTWTQVASSHVQRDLCPSTILMDGRYMIVGGEYFGGPDNATADIYDPVNDAWTAASDMPAPIGDTATSILPNGNFLVSSVWTPNVYIFTAKPASAHSAQWQASLQPIGTGISGEEKGWTLLQNGSVLDAFDGWSVYSYGSDSWSTKRSFPSGMTLVDNGEIGPMSLLYSGKVIQFGGVQTGIYDPTAPPATAWTSGPSAPDGRVFDDSPAAVMPSGNVLCTTSANPNGSGNDIQYFEYVPGQSFLSVPLPPFGQSNSLFVVLPTGQVLVEPLGGPSPNFYVYTSPSGTTAGSGMWQPTIISVSTSVSGQFLLKGTQLNGLTTGASYGDDHNMATNFPIVSLVDTTGHKYYARSFGFDQMAPRAGWVGSTSFVLPTGIPNGSYNVHVSANGVDSSNTMPLTVSGIHVTQVSGQPAAPGATAPWTVTVNPAAPAGGTSVSLLSSNVGVVTVPTTVVVPAFATTVQFNVTGHAFGTAIITAVTTTPNSQFTPARGAFGWAVNSVTPVPGGSATVEMLTLSRPAPSGGITVQLSANMPSVGLPATVVVSANMLSAKFSVTTTANPGLAVITASLYNSSASGYLFAQFFHGPNVWDTRWGWLQLLWL